MTSPWTMLAEMPDVDLVWTTDDSILHGRRAQWFPSVRTIAMDARLTRKLARCSIAHEIAHVVLDHPAACDIYFYDQRVELDADRFASRMLLPDIEQIAIELATTSTTAHAASNLYVTLDLLDVRLAALTPAEHAFISQRVTSVHEGVGA